MLCELKYFSELRKQNNSICCETIVKNTEKKYSQLIFYFLNVTFQLRTVAEECCMLRSNS